ncbi:hypothetical protein WISP_143629 [Willisornis vidua]|uniref:Uncharacterized protein n=1 Tax=Willisornis vidua TaxID=1566151 RepID=A0ABQ9CMC9_9PASS|nr:hypothetical protein WISP_143629 [Willisornis vidua]
MVILKLLPVVVREVEYDVVCGNNLPLDAELSWEPEDKLEDYLSPFRAGAAEAGASAEAEADSTTVKIETNEKDDIEREAWAPKGKKRDQDTKTEEHHSTSDSLIV